MVLITRTHTGLSMCCLSFVDANWINLHERKFQFYHFHDQGKWVTTTMTTTMNIRIRKPRSCRCTTISQSTNLQFLFVIKLYLFTHFNWPITNSSSCWNLEFHECNTERQLIRKLTPERYSRYFTSSLRYLRYDWSFFLSVSADRFLFALM